MAPSAVTGDTYAIHPPEVRWTHVALRVKDLDASINWYTENTPLSVLDRREDEMGYGAWLGHDDSPDSPFILVLAQFFPDTDPFKEAPNTVLGPFAHLGIEMPSRSILEETAKKLEAAGSLVMPLTERPPPVGYVLFAQDPDGNTVEFSYDQGVYATAQEVWG